MGGPGGRGGGPEDRGEPRRPAFGDGDRRNGPNPGSSRLIGGKWWTSPAVVRRLSLTADQQRDLEDVFQQNRLKLIDLTAALEKEQAILDPLLSADHPQDAKVLAQIDRVADARAALEKTTARMLYSFRVLLTSEQWRQLRFNGDDARSLEDPGRPPGRGPARFPNQH